MVLLEYRTSCSTYAIRLPSGDQLGDLLMPFVVSARQAETPEVAASTTYRSLVYSSHSNSGGPKNAGHASTASCAR